MKENKRVAVFIDAENISAKFADRLLAEASNYGDVIVRRVFADWSSVNVQAWKEVVSRYSLIAEQQFSAVKGKNSGDISLIINAMIVLFEKDIDVFCLASSDSDFTRLVQELREREKVVIGLGLKQTAQAFVNAFSEFIYLDNSDQPKEKAPTMQKAEKCEFCLEPDRQAALKEIIDKLIEEDGWALFARIATEMKNKFSDFVPKNYNCRSLKELITKIIHTIGNYEIRTGTDGTTMFLIAGSSNSQALLEKKDHVSEKKQPPKKTRAVFKNTKGVNRGKAKTKHSTKKKD
ncbi:MAG: NYN domain-containing protein [Clostridia bacterium]|nr:NYN domain-containing protein [Clostridia bacterium]